MTTESGNSPPRTRTLADQVGNVTAKRELTASMKLLDLTGPEDKRATAAML
jgi:hypothetical protein